MEDEQKSWYEQQSGMNEEDRAPHIVFSDVIAHANRLYHGHLALARFPETLNPEKIDYRLKLIKQKQIPSYDDVILALKTYEEMEIGIAADYLKKLREEMESRMSLLEKIAQKEVV